MNIYLKRLILPALLLLILLPLSSCDKDDDPASSDIVGTWYGTRSYYNPVGGTKYQYLTITFEANGFGSLEYEAPTSYSAAKFTYSVQNNTVTCKGAYANTDGVVEGDFVMNLRREDNRLIPIDKYNMFILTKDNSVMTDGNGNELIDDSELIRGVWWHSSKEVVLVIDNNDFTEYTLMSASSNIYSKKTEGSFSYNLLQKYVLINGAKFDVLALSESTLQLKSSNGTIFNYTRGTNADIPTNGQNSNNYKEILENSKFGWVTNESITRLIKFYDSNNVYYLEESTKSSGVNLSAKGSYSLSGKTITCTYTDIYWDFGDSIYKNYFPGWTFGKTNTKIYTMESINVEKMVLKCDGETYIFYNSDLK